MKKGTILMKEAVRRSASMLSAVIIAASSVSIPAFAEDRETVCGKAEHVHTADCYTRPLICGLEESEPVTVTRREFVSTFRTHRHTDACKDENGNYVCGQVEGEYAHKHNDFCYDENGNLVCGLQARSLHKHYDGCYETRLVLVCDNQDEGHEHTEDCYREEKVLICDKPVYSTHTHSEACFDQNGRCVCGAVDIPTFECTADNWVETVETVEEGHRHTEECYGEPALICELPEHVHTEDCYAPVQVTEEQTEVQNETADDGENDNGIEITGENDAAAPEEENKEETDSQENAAENDAEAGSNNEENPDAEAAVGEAGEEENNNVEVTVGEIAVEVAVVEEVAVEKAAAEVTAVEENNDENNIVEEINDEENNVEENNVEENNVEENNVEENNVEENNVEENTVEAKNVEENNDEENNVEENTVEEINDEENNVEENTVEENNDEENNVEENNVEENTVEENNGEENNVEENNVEENNVEENTVEENNVEENNVEENNDEENNVEENNVEENNDEENTVEENNVEEKNVEENNDEENNVEENTVEEPAYLEGLLTFEGIGFVVTARFGQDACFPVGTELLVREILPGTEEYMEYSGQTEEALNGSWDKMTTARFFDIRFMFEDQMIEPSGPVDVQITFADAISVAEENDLQAIHFTKDGAQMIDADAQAADGSAVDTVAFTTGSFSVYGFVQTETIEWKYLTAEGSTCTIQVAYSKDANLPDGAELVIRDIAEGSEEWNDYRQRLIALLEADDVVLPGLFDISILADGEKVQPASAVRVMIRLNETPQEETPLVVVHFPEEQVQAQAAPSLTKGTRNALRTMGKSGTTQVQTKGNEASTDEITVASSSAPAPETITASVDENTVTFEATGFSVYALAYTVDFIVNGQEYSIVGGGVLSLRELLQSMGSNIDIGEIANVFFSNEALVQVVPITEDTTAGALKETLGLAPSYSAELTDEDIRAMDALALTAPDWALISLKPFKTDEKLTIIITNGKTFDIAVTDAQLVRYYIDSMGDTYKITVTYEDDAGIPEDATLEVMEILPEDEQFDAYLTQAIQALGGAQPAADQYARFFDITIMNGKEKVTPKAPVSVSIALADAPEGEKLQVVHFDEADGPVVMEATATEDAEGANVQFETDSFSVYGLIVEPINVDTNLDGMTAKIRVGGSYLIADTEYSERPWRIKKTADINQAAEYTFEATETPGVYGIYTLVNGTKYYIHINHNDDDPDWGSGANGSVNLTDYGPMGLTVSQESNGTYRISRTINGRTYYLNEHYGSSGNGIASYTGNDGGSVVTLDFTTPVLENSKEYMVIVKRNEDDVDKYYIVLNDGTLSSVQYNEDDHSVTVDNPMLWYYTGDHLYHDSTQVGYNYQDLPSDSYYRYIDPSSKTALNEDDATNTTTDGTASGSGAGPKITSRSLWGQTALTYTTDNKLRSSSNRNFYIGVAKEGGTYKLVGQATEENAATIFFADAVKVNPVGWQNHVVSHIDISIQGTAAADVPLAYGKYYDENHNVKLDITSFTKLHLTEEEVTDKDQLKVTPEDMKRSTINTYLKDGTNLNDMFYVTGYSANPIHGSSTAQVRIEGAFKVANLDNTEYETVNTDLYNQAYWDQSANNWAGAWILTDAALAYRNKVHEARLQNRIYYSVTVIKPVTFDLVYTEYVTDPEDPENTIPVKTQLYDADGVPLTITADVAFSASFDYWDTRNVCPPIHDPEYGYVDQWKVGGIPDHNLSGMDFGLGANPEGTAKVYAVEITKIVVDENGNRIRTNDAGTNKFYIYKNSEGVDVMTYNTALTSYVKPEYDDVKDLNIGSFTQTPDYSKYSLQHEKTISVGDDGLGLVYDYDVQPGLYYIKEDPASIVDQITDISGQTWDYKDTYILTEYAWRNHANDNYMHVSDTFEKTITGEYADSDYSSIPEILGLHYGYNGEDGPYTNDFLEFYVYNVYESQKVDVPVIKTWADFEDAQYDWQAVFTLQWAPLYEGEDAPTTAFQDVTPVKTMTINKADMAGITQELIDRYLAKDSTLTQDEIDRIEALTFKDLPKYGADTNGNTFRYQYSLEETSYRVTDSSTGVIIYSWSNSAGYNDPENGHYVPYYPHDAGENVSENAEANEANTNYYVHVVNKLKVVSQKEYIDVNIEKQWDIDSNGTADTRNQDDWAEFELRRYVHTEYRDMSHMSDKDKTAEPITVTLKDEAGNILHTLQVQPNMGLYLGGNFQPHDSERSVTFEALPAVRLANGSRVTTITATASGSNMSNAMVRSQEFFVTQDTEFTLKSGSEYLVAGNPARILDTGAGTNPVQDRSFSQTVRLDSTNNWQETLSQLLRVETTEGDNDNDNVTVYEYYFVEKDSNPSGHALYYRADNGAATETLSGDSDHRIEQDDSIIAVNGPSNRLIVKKYWRGVPDTTGFPPITFTLYQAWADGNDGWVYVNDKGQSYQNIVLSGTALEWICPEVLPPTKLDTNQNGNPSRAVKYYVQEDNQSGTYTEGNITVSWQFYYYLNSVGDQTNAGHQGYFAAMDGSYLEDNGGTITICNKLDIYIQLDIQKQFFRLEEDGAWNNVTANPDMKRNAVLGFKVIRAIQTADGKWLDEAGNESDRPVWLDYSEEMLCGYDENGAAVVHRGENDIFWLHDAGGDWHFRIEDNQGDANNVRAGGSGLPGYGFYVKNGEDIPVQYWYSFRETNVYKDVNRTPYPEWDWFSSVTPVNAYSANGRTMEAFPRAFSGQDNARIANFQASDLIIDKEWIGGDPTATAVYVKIWRTSGNGEPEDFTAVIAEDIRNNQNWQNYMNDPSEIDLSRNCLILKPDNAQSWEASIKVNRALLGSLAESGKYRYYIQEVGYRTASGEYKTNVNSQFKPLYDKWVGTASGGAYSGAPVGMNDYAENSITIGSKGENRLKVINRVTASTSYAVTKDFYGDTLATGQPSSVTGKYPTDGSKQVVIELQQRYRYEKTDEDGVEYVSADNEYWVRKDSEDAADIWAVEWQAADSASPQTVTLPLDKPAGSVLSDEAWYGSAAAWSYTWDGLDITKVISDNTAQLYYRAVEKGAQDWFTVSTDQNGHIAVNETVLTQSIRNVRENCDLKLNKEWTGLGTGVTWPAGYVVYYQLEQHYHLAQVDLTENTPVYSSGPAFKTVDMVTSYEGASDNVHPQAVSTLEESNHNLTLSGLPMFGFFTATEDDVTEAAEAGITLQAGVTYAVTYTYSARETAVKYNGTDVAFTPQTVDFDESNTATLTNEYVSVEVTKTWASGTPYADSVTVKLYRTTEIPADQLCLTTINLSFGSNSDKITDATITASVGGKTVQLVKDGENDLWTGTVRLEKGTEPTIAFTAPAAAEGCTVTLNDRQITVPDAETYTVYAAGTVAEQQSGRTITVTITNSVTSDGSWGVWGPQINYNNGWPGMTSGDPFPVEDQNEHIVQFGVWGSIPEGIVLKLGDVTLDTSTGTTIQYTVPAGSDAVTVVGSVYQGGGQQNGTTKGTISPDSSIGTLEGPWGVDWNNLRVGQKYTLTMNIKNTLQDKIRFIVTGATSKGYCSSKWDDYNGEWKLEITPTDKDTQVVILLTAADETSAAPKTTMMALRGQRQTLRTQSVTPSAVTVNMDHESVDPTLVTVGADEYPVFTAEDLVDTQTLNASNGWHYQWTNLPVSDPDTGATYYYYVIEEVPDNTKTVTYTRTEADNNTAVTIENAPVVNKVYGSLTVTKAVQDEDGNTLDTSRDFTIRLKREKDETTGWLHYTDGSNYSWGAEDGASTWTFNNGGSVAFTGLETGYTYTVVEDTGTGMVEIEGYEFDLDSSTTTFVASDLSAQEYTGTIINKYKSFGALKITKAVTVNGAEWTDSKAESPADGTYTFTISGPNSYSNTGSITVTNGVSENSIELTGLTPGEYTITEYATSNGTTLSNVTGDGTEGTVDRGVKLTVEAGDTADQNVARFTNNKPYITYNPKVTKDLTGRNWKTGDSFTFTLAATPASGMTMPENNTVTIGYDDVEKTKSFDAVTFTAGGTYTFTVTETVPDDAVNSSNVRWDAADSTAKAAGGFVKDGITYDGDAHALTVVVNDTNGTLTITRINDSPVADQAAIEAVSTTVTNTYDTSTTAHIEGTKTFKHGTIGENQFQFTVTGADESTPLPSPTTVFAGTNGTIVFDEMTYPLSLLADVTADETTGIKSRTFTYTVKEELPDDVAATQEETDAGYKIVNGIKYDLTEKTVTVTVNYTEATGVMNATVDPPVTGLTFTNEQLGSVQVIKTFNFPSDSGLTAPSEFKIKATWTIEYTDYTAELTTSSGTQTVTIVDPETQAVTTTDFTVSAVSGTGPYTWTISNLPIGTKVSFEESGYGMVGYNVTSTVSEDRGTPTAGINGHTTAAVEPGTVEIINEYVAGVELPSTGGSGTTAFYAVGAVMALGAAVWMILLRRRRETN